VRRRRIGSGGTKLEQTEPRSVILASQIESAPVRLGPARQGLDLRGVVQLAVEPARFEQEERRLPVVASGLHPDLGDAPAAQPVAERLQLAPGRGEGPGLLLAVACGGVAGHPDGDLDLGLGDVQAGDPLGEQRLVLDVLHHRLLR
jgi:hypothetical protein